MMHISYFCQTDWSLFILGPLTGAMSNVAIPSDESPSESSSSVFYMAQNPQESAVEITPRSNEKGVLIYILYACGLNFDLQFFFILKEVFSLYLC